MVDWYNSAAAVAPLAQPSLAGSLNYEQGRARRPHWQGPGPGPSRLGDRNTSPASKMCKFKLRGNATIAATILILIISDDSAYTGKFQAYDLPGARPSAPYKLERICML